MKNILIVMATNREPQARTLECIRVLGTGGAAFLKCEAGSDVAHARNYTLSQACESLREDPEKTIVFMVDDDVIFSAEDAAELARQTLERAQPCSMLYGTQEGRGCVGLWLKGGRFADGTFKWRVGLGALMIPREILLELEAESETYEVPGAICTEFTWCCAEDGEWIAEDYRLSQRLGGVRLLPLEAGHLKTVPLFPDELTLEEVRRLLTYTGAFPMPKPHDGPKELQHE